MRQNNSTNDMLNVHLQSQENSSDGISAGLMRNSPLEVDHQRNGEPNTFHESVLKSRRSLKKSVRSAKSLLASSYYTINNDEMGGTLGLWGTVLGIMSTIVGGGMVGVPWAFLNCGFILAGIFSLLASAQVIFSSVLFLRARQICPDRPQSMYEIGFLILGRSSIFWISFIIFVNSFFLLVIFFNVFGETMKATMTNIFWADVNPEEPNFGMKRECWVLSLGVLLLPFIQMKELAELKLVSIALFCAALIFVGINIIQLISRGNSLSNFDTDHSVYFKPTFNKNFIQSLAIIFTACNF